MKRFLFLSLILLCVALPDWGQSAAVNAFVGDSVLRPASVGIYIVNVGTGEVVASANEWQAHIPASTVKLVTSATALRLLGDSFEPYTRVDVTGRVDSAGVLHGDLVVHGGGDPTLGSAYGSRVSADFVHSVLRNLQIKGVRQITGKIRFDNSFFEGYTRSPKVMLEDISWAYGAACQALNYRDNRLVVKLKAEGGRYNVVEVSPSQIWEISVELIKGEKENIVVEREGNQWCISGTLPRAREYYTLELSVDHPEEMLEHDLSRLLSQAGIIVLGREGFETTTLSTTLLKYSGETLGEVVKSLNFRSDNLYAESVLRLLPSETNTPRSAEAGLNTIRRYWQGCGIDSLALFLYDGSGLSRSNKISAEYIGKVLVAMAQDSVVGDIFVLSLPLVGKEGSVKSFMCNHQLPGELRLKSGSMSDVQAYAGYYTTAHNRYAVVVMVNNYTCSRAELRRKISTLLTRVLAGSQ